MSYEEHEILLPPRPPKVAHLIDPGFSTSRTYDTISEPCRVDDEIDAGDFWKGRPDSKLLRRVPREGLK